MELLAGGTLRDRVREQGPLPPAEAVDAILQIIAGLDAAQAGGILHRDIKPANCFIDRDGTVKVGDFGLSISTMARDVTQLTTTGTFRGTPQFAAPEQLKGDPLDVRADIYAVGATLYYLLTGQPPFDDTDLMALLTRVATEAPRSPRDVEPPCRAASRPSCCVVSPRTASRVPRHTPLSKRALRPFGSAAPTPATLGLRLMAGVIDRTIWIPLGMILPYVTFWVSIAIRREGMGPPSWPFVAVPIALSVAYYAVPEGLWGASLGKWVAGLRVGTADGEPPGMALALRRALVFAAPAIVSALFAGLFVQTGAPRPGDPPWLPVATSWVLFALLFSTARRRNGFAGIHDLVSGTRVVRRLERRTRTVVAAPLDPAHSPGTNARRYGPYEVTGTLGATDAGDLLVGFDPSLRRRVWIHTLPAGTAPVTPLIRELSRPARLRWLGGRRSATEAWDAYKAVDGAPLATLLGTPQTWRAVRAWLLDLAREINAGLTDGSIAALTTDYVWITRDGYAKLLDFRAPGGPLANQEAFVTLESAQVFLASVARRALDAPRSTPLSASSTLETLERSGFTSSWQMVASIAALLQGPARVERGRRAAHLASFARHARADLAGSRAFQPPTAPHAERKSVERCRDAAV